MLDHRLYTFLGLCDTMNYRQTAENLHISQPAVTQHIQYLESAYSCKLFSYEGRTLSLTEGGEKLQRYARSAVARQEDIALALTAPEKRQFRLGATKTIGDYVMGDYVLKLLEKPEISLSVQVDNTSRLLQMLDENSLDFALIEGYFDKNKYGNMLFRKEDFVGICAKNHAFAGREVALDDVLGERVIVREEGSGTRALLETGLLERTQSLESFAQMAVVNSFELTKELVRAGAGISFVYASVVKKEKEIGKFTVRDFLKSGQFHLVYLPHRGAEEKVSEFLAGVSP